MGVGEKVALKEPFWEEKGASERVLVKKNLIKRLFNYTSDHIHGGYKTSTGMLTDVHKKSARVSRMKVPIIFCHDGTDVYLRGGGGNHNK